MKRKLFCLLSFLCLFGAGAWAQGWTSAQDGIYMLYDNDAGLFLARNGDWGTQAIMTDFGAPILITTDGNGATKFTLRDTGKTVFTNNGGTSYYCDNTQNNTFTIEGVDGETGFYYIKNIGANKYVGAKNGVLGEAQHKWRLIRGDDVRSIYAAKELTALKSVATQVGFYVNDIQSVATAMGDLSATLEEVTGAGFPTSRGESWQPKDGSSSGTHTARKVLTLTLTAPTAGLYRIEYPAMYRMTSYAKVTENAVVDADFASAYVACGNYTTAMATLTRDASETAYHTDNASGVIGGVTKYFPNGQDGFQAWAENGCYRNALYAYAATDGAKISVTFNLNIGVLGDCAQWFVHNPATAKMYKVKVDLNSTLNKFIADAAAVLATYTQGAGSHTVLSNGIAAAQTATLTTEADLVQAEKALEQALSEAAYRYQIETLQSQGDGADWTSMIVNPNFESDFNGWTNKGLAIQNNTSFGKTGNKYAEKWQPNGDFSVEQTIKALPAGVYCLTVDAKARGVASASLYANELNQDMVIGDVQNTYSTYVQLQENGDLTIGAKAKGTGAGSSWFCVDNFTLTYVGAEFPALSAVTGKFNAEVAADQTGALAAFEADKTAANYQAARNAIAAAQESVAKYAAAAAAFAAQDALLASTNVYDVTAKEAYVTACEGLKAKYSDNTLKDEVVVNPEVGTGVRTSTDYNFMLTPWTVGGTACNNFDTNFYINTWSIEGANDGSNFLVPFYEYWTNDANSLGANDLVATMTGLEKGLYKVNARVRVRAKNEVDASVATGITMAVNEGDAVAVTTGSQVDNSQFVIANYEAQGLVKDGTLLIQFNVAEGNNISWLAFRDVKYTKVRDLTPEEEIVYATEADIAALNAAIATAKGYVMGFEAGEYAPYENIDVVKELAKAEALDVENPINVEIVNAAIAAIAADKWTVNTEELNAFYNGNFALTADKGAPAGWTMSNNTLGGDYHARAIAGDNRLAVFNDTQSAFYMRFDGTYSNRGSLYHYGLTEGYTIPLKGGVTYRLDFDFGGWNQQANTRFIVGTKDNVWKNIISVDKTPTHKVDQEGTPDHITLFFTPDADDNFAFTVQNPSGDANNAIIFSNAKLFKAPAAEASMTITDAKWGTFIAPFDVTVPEGVTASKVTGVEESGTLTLEEVTTTIPANTPVVVYSESAVDETFNGQSVATQDTYNVGLLTGVYVDTQVPVGDYLLQKNNDIVAFYQVGSAEGAARPYVRKNRAYLSVPAGGSIKAFYFDETDAVQSIAGDKGEEVIFDLQGRRVQKAVKGIYIINGKKTLK